MYDDDNLYLLFLVTDDQLFDDSDGADEHDDGLDIVFDTDNGDETSPDEFDDYILTVEYSSTGVCAISGEKWSFGTLDETEIEAACTDNPDIDGYNIEVKIPFINLLVDTDQIIGFGITGIKKLMRDLYLKRFILVKFQGNFGFIDFSRTE